MNYRERLNVLLTSSERLFIRKLSTPQKIQDYLDSLPINFETNGETYMSPRRTMTVKRAHCFEGALIAAASLTIHGQRPLLMDLRTEVPYEDHVVALFRSNGFWGAISKTNHVILRYRDAVYRSPRELAMSYFHEYIEDNGTKSLREYSAPFDLSHYSPEKWVIAEEELFSLVDALNSSRHFPIAPKKNIRQLRKAAPIEIDAGHLIEWKKPKKTNSRANS
jgi:hypothetical protein